MEQRLERLASRVLEDNRFLLMNDSGAADCILNADKEERIRRIRETYSKLIVIDEDSLLVGQYTNISLLESVRRKDLAEDLRALAGKYISYKNKLYLPAGDHFALDFGYVLKRGISGLVEQIEETRKTTVGEEQRSFLAELYFSTQAVIAWTEAYTDALRIEIQKCRSEKRRAELEQMADICNKVPYLPASSFREAIQSYYFAFILFSHDGIGRLDQYLYPYYISDVQKGILSRDEALALIEELFIKIFGLLGKNESRSANHHGVVAGYTAEGECGHNECTSLVLQAISEIPVWRPQISYRVTKKTTHDQLREAFEAHCKRPDLVMFLNDDAILKGLINAGVSYKDAVEYSSSGCNETVLTGCSNPGALEGHINVMYSLDRLLKDENKLSGINSFDGFYKAFEEALGEDLDVIFRYSCDKDEIKAQSLLPMRSLLTSGCISSGRSIMRGGAKYNFCTWCLTGLINLADSLSIIRQMVFEEGRYSLKELNDFLEANWRGYEEHRAYILNNGRYFGNDDDYVDLLVNRICASVKQFAERYTPYRGGRYLFGTLTGYELAHIVYGGNSGASVDGRFASEPYAAAIAAYPGADKKGATAYLKSVAKIDSELLQSSVVTNLMLDRALIETAEKRELITSVLHAYFRLGGIQLQINYSSADELKKAKKDPDKYRSLRVRVTGFSGFFTSLEPNLQDEIISRHLHKA